MKKILLFMFFLSSLILKSQHDNGFFLGTNIGGPLPDKMADSSEAKLKPGISAGFEKIIFQRNKLSAGIVLSYDYSHLEYSQTIFNDTLMPLPFDESIKVPTYYYARVSGTMNLHYTGASLFFGYSPIKSTEIKIGGFSRYMFAGHDKGTVNVVIGEGGFFDDYNENYNNTDNIRKMDIGIFLGCEQKIYKHFSLGIKLSRSLIAFYKEDISLADDSDTDMFNTYVSFLMIYQFTIKQDKND